MTRILALLTLASAAAWGQFNSLATPSDGSAVYFTTGLRLKNSFESPWGKVFAADERGVRLVESRDPQPLALPPDYSGTCVVGRLSSFFGVELSSDGKVLALGGSRAAAGQCHGPAAATLLRTPSGSRDSVGSLRISANGKWALLTTTPTFSQQTTASILDLTTGGRTDFSVPSLGPATFASGRTIANDGTAVLVANGKGYIARPGGTAQPFPSGYPTAISATGARVLYISDAVHLFDLASQADQQLSTASRLSSGGLSDDGSRAAFVEDGQLWVADWNGGGARQTTSVADGITSAVLSGNGKIAYAVTGTGRLLKVVVETGEAVELIPRTPEAAVSGAIVDAGTFVTIPGRGLTDQSATATPPLPLTLGGVSVIVGGRPVPLSRVTPTAIDALIPWDLVGTNLPVVVNAAPSNTPFEPNSQSLTAMTGTRAGGLYRQDWSPITDLTVHPGEIIHVYAVGLGPVTPEVAPGTLAPAAEPLARLASPMSCSNAAVLFAGLQPGALTRVYQVDLQIGTKTGYQVFGCNIATGGFPFLTLNVAP